MPLSEVKGQSQAIEAIQKAFLQQRLHHAYLLHGTLGVGKKLTAFKIAEKLLCKAVEQSPQNQVDSCGHCTACKRVQKQARTHEEAHPDLHIIQREINSKGKVSHEIKIAQIRALQKKLSYQAFEGGNRVVIIVAAECMNQATSNALLKTLEEPGENTYFLLISSKVDRLLPTIISRCQKLRFTHLPHQLMIELLHVHSSSNLEDETLSTLARLGDGSIGRALSYLEQDFYLQIPATLQQADGEQGIPHLVDAWPIIQKYERSSEQELRLWFHLLRSWYRDILLIQQGGAVHQVTHSSLVSIAQKRAQELSFERLLWRIKALQNAEIHIFERVGSQKRLILEALIFYLSGADRTINRALTF